MTTGNLPQPEAPGPIPGEPGHFAHHDWLDASVGVLNQRLVKMWKQTAVQSTQSATWTGVVFGTVVLDTGLDITADQQAGGVVLGPSAPAGLYRMDMTIDWGNVSTGNRRVHTLLNGAGQVGWEQRLAGASGSGVVNSISGLIVLPAGAVLKPEAYQNTGANLDITANTRLHLEYLGEPDTDGGTAALSLDYDPPTD